MFLRRNIENYRKIIPVTPSYLEHCFRVLIIEKQIFNGVTDRRQTIM